MTTIAYKNGVLASDGQVTAGGTITGYNTRKIFNVNGHLVGAAGRYSECLQFVKWLEAYIHYEDGVASGITNAQPPEPFDRDNFAALVIDPERVVWEFEGGKDMFVVQPPCAIGSGGVYALAAMKAGASAEEAVKIAIEMDPYSGGDVFCEKVMPYLEELDDDELISVAKAEGFKITKKHKREDILKMFSEDES